MPVNSEMGAMAVIIGAALGDGKEEWESDSSATFHMSHTRAGMIAYTKEAPRTTSKSLMETLYR